MMSSRSISRVYLSAGGDNIVGGAGRGTGAEPRLTSWKKTGDADISLPPLPSRRAPTPPPNRKLFTIHLKPAFTVCPGSADPFYVVINSINWATTSWTYSIMCKYYVKYYGCGGRLRKKQRMGGGVI